MSALACASMVLAVGFFRTKLQLLQPSTGFAAAVPPAAGAVAGAEPGLAACAAGPPAAVVPAASSSAPANAASAPLIGFLMGDFLRRSALTAREGWVMARALSARPRAVGLGAAGAMGRAGSGYGEGCGGV